MSCLCFFWSSLGLGCCLPVGGLKVMHIWFLLSFLLVLPSRFDVTHLLVSLFLSFLCLYFAYHFVYRYFLRQSVTREGCRTLSPVFQPISGFLVRCSACALHLLLVLRTTYTVCTDPYSITFLPTLCLKMQCFGDRFHLFLYFPGPLCSYCASVSSYSLGFELLRSFWCSEELLFWCLVSFLSVLTSRFVVTQLLVSNVLSVYVLHCQGGWSSVNAQM